MRGVFAVFLSLAVAGCANIKVSQLPKSAIQEKTIAVPIGNEGVLGVVKDILRENGWTLSTHGGGSVTEGSLGGREIYLRTGSEAAGTRYQLIVRQRRYSACLSGGDAYNYDVTVLDTRTRAEIVSVNGSGCLSPVTRTLKEQISASI